MKRLTITIILCLTAIAAMAQSRIITDTLSSKILGKDVPYNVYLPAGYDKSDAQYPVVYLLHGLYGTHTDWPNTGRMKLVADPLIASGEAVPMVIIMPCAGHEDVHNVQNGYFNMPGCNYEDFFFQELLPTVEKKYRCIGDKEHRAIMGLSMGGGGSTVYCQRHPEMFSSCYAMSAWLDVVEEDKRRNLEETDKLYIVAKSVMDHSALEFISKADDATIEKLKTVKWFFDCGDDDYLLSLSVNLHFMMTKKGIRNELRVRDGGHTWEYWHTALYNSLPFASRNFAK
ncbi:MAG: esterase family protein [Bacteroidales bacterium]|nr:esterase family protein [Bacteroidales bacterium]